MAPIAKRKSWSARYKDHRNLVDVVGAGLYTAVLTFALWTSWSARLETRGAEDVAKLYSAANDLQIAERRTDFIAMQVKDLRAGADEETMRRLAERLQQEWAAARMAQDRVARLSEPVLLSEGIDKVVRVFYATDRNHSTASGTASYGRDRGEVTRYGVCDVSIPKSHIKGSLETPWQIWRFKGAPKPSKHIVFEHATEFEPSEFYEALRRDLAKCASHEVFIFIHGFANSFVDAARRSAQLSYDLQYDGVPMMFSWPSNGEVSVPDYLHDETNVDWTIPHLRSFLQEVAEQSGADSINVVAHSMGNKIMANALSGLADEARTSGRPTFNNVVLTAPDIDVDVFKDSLVPAIKNHSNRLTLYASSNDRALAFSKLMHGNYRRVGDSTPEIFVADGIDSVDVSAIDTYFFSAGHSYFGTNRSIVEDLSLLLRHGFPPSKRFLVQSPANGPKYWIFRP
jgi:esterase/lipase superfamily enzyme